MRKNRPIGILENGHFMPKLGVRALCTEHAYTFSIGNFSDRAAKIIIVSIYLLKRKPNGLTTASISKLHGTVSLKCTGVNALSYPVHFNRGRFEITKNDATVK